MKTKTLKTSELEGKALDYVVFTLICPDLHKDVFLGHYMNYRYYDKTYQFSTCWADGGPIIEMEGMSIMCHGDSWTVANLSGVSLEEGSTPLIAAMRCYVASKLGDEIEIPEELTRGE